PLLSFPLRRRPPPGSTLFPYTTLFRSRRCGPSAARPRQQLRRHAPVAFPRQMVCLGLARSHRPVGADLAAAWAAVARLVSFGERSEEHTSELQSRGHLVCRLLLEKKKI